VIEIDFNQRPSPLWKEMVNFRKKLGLGGITDLELAGGKMLCAIDKKNVIIATAAMCKVDSRTGFGRIWNKSHPCLADKVLFLSIHYCHPTILVILITYIIYS
jgi:hypothetical protein